MSQATVNFGHSPDPDDAFMFYGIAAGAVDTGGLEIRHVMKDIETLNHWALEGRLEATAISVHAYPYVQQHYSILPFGASVGDQYGPILVARQMLSEDELRRASIAVPGLLTTAYLVLKLMLGQCQVTVFPFDAIGQAVADGSADAGLLIHEGQLTYQNQGLVKVADLGQWWYRETALPLPLGCDLVRRDLGEVGDTIARAFEASIRHALSHRQAALEYAMQYARDLSPALVDRFVGMYVNQDTLSYGERGRRAVEELLSRGHKAGIISVAPRVEFHRSADQHQ